MGSRDETTLPCGLLPTSSPYPSFTHAYIQPPPVEDEESEDTGASASASASGGTAELFTGVSIKVSTVHALKRRLSICLFLPYFRPDDDCNIH